MEIWEPKPAGTLWATPGMLRGPFTFTFTFIAYYECVFVTVAFAVSPSVACATLAILFSALSHKLYDLKKNVIEHKMCGLIFCTTFVLKNSHSRKNYTIYDIFVNCNWVVTRWQ